MISTISSTYTACTTPTCCDMFFVHNLCSYVRDLLPKIDSHYTRPLLTRCAFSICSRETGGIQTSQGCGRSCRRAESVKKVKEGNMNGGVVYCHMYILKSHRFCSMSLTLKCCFQSSVRPSVYLPPGHSFSNFCDSLTGTGVEKQEYFTNIKTIWIIIKMNKYEYELLCAARLLWASSGNGEVSFVAATLADGNCASGKYGIFMGIVSEH